MHKVHKVMEEKYLCSCIFSHHLVIFFEITQMLNSYAQSDFKKKKSQLGVCYSNDRLKSSSFLRQLKNYGTTLKM